jgi:hypothetical protein
MPTLLRSSESMGCGATIKLDSGEAVYVSIAQVGVVVRHWDMSGGFFKTLMSNYFGAKLYNESTVYKNAQTAQALSMMFPNQAPELQFKNPVLAVFSNAIWHCGSTAEVCTVLNEAAAKIPELERAFEAGTNSPSKRSPEMTAATYQVVYSDGVTQETRLLLTEIEKWVIASNRAEAEKPYRIVRVVDSQGRVVWGR